MSIDLQEDKIDNVDIYNYDIVYNLKIIKKMIDNNVYFIFDHEDSISKILFRTTIYKDRDIALKESINLNNFKKTTENISLPEACLTIFRNHLLSIEEVDFYEIEKMCPDLITDKSKKIKISILSNGTPDLLKGLVESNNIQNYFDDIMSIESVGIYKPDSKVYEMPIKKYNCKPENICFMSSNTWDVSGGGVFGYNAVWVNRFNKVFDKLSYKPQFVINNLNELLEIV